MKFTIVGPGAIGLLIGSLLHRGGYDVEFVCKDSRQMDKLVGGIELEGLIKYSFLPKLKLACDDSSDYIIIAVKAYDTRKALDKIKKGDAVVVSLQNGIGNYEVIRSKFKNVIIGVTTCASTKIKDNRVRFVNPGLTKLGNPENSLNDEIEEVAKVLSSVGLPSYRSEDILKDLWIKASINCVINSITSIFCIKNGEILEREELSMLAELLTKECSRALNILGYNIDLESRVFDVIKKTRENISSTLQDILNGKETEIDYFIKPIAEIINSILLETIYYMVKSREWVKCPE